MSLDEGRDPGRSSRYWLPCTGSRALVAIDFACSPGLFSLLYLRKRADAGFAHVVARPNHFRLRELEALLVELDLPLPESLRRYFLAALAEDVAELARLEPHVRPLRRAPPTLAPQLACAARRPQLASPRM